MKKFGTAVVLAGGKSSRMGFDKQLLRIGKRPLISVVLSHLQTCFKDIIVVTSYPELYEGMPVRTVKDMIPGRGPLSGIHAALSLAESEYIYAVACDMPHFDEAYCRYLQKCLEAQPSDACVTCYGEWIEPFHAFYGKGLLPALDDCLRSDNTSVHRLLRRCDTLYIPERTARLYTPDWALFLNLNTREKYAEYLAGLRNGA